MTSDSPSTHAIVPDAGARPIFIAEIEQLGGAERSLLALSRWLTANGLANYLLTYTDHCDFRKYASFPLQIVALNPGGGPRAKIAALKKYLAGRPADSPAMLCSGYQPALHATLAGVRGFHDLMLDTPSLFGDEETRSLAGKLRIAVSNRIIGVGLRSGGVTIVNSEYLKAESRRNFGIEAEIVRMGGMSSPDNEALASGHAARRVVRGGPLSMLSVCRIEPNKRIDWMLRALAVVEKEAVAPLDAPLSSVVDWHLELAGKGSKLEEMQALAEALGIGDRVHFHGFVSDEALGGIYAKADLFLMPAVQGYGIPALEAIERGIPVLLHRESGISDVLLETPWAVVLEGGEENLPAAIAKAVMSVLDGRQRGVEPPRLASEDEWAELVARKCGWT